MQATKSNRLDVCIITTIHKPFDARIYERGLATLVEAGYRVCLISPWKRPTDPWLDHEWVTLKPPKRRIHRILHGYKTFIAALKQNVRAYHFHDIDFLLWAVLLRLLKRVPVIYDCHENYPEEVRYQKGWIPKALRRPTAWTVRNVENCAARILGTCMVVVPSQKERFDRLRVNTILVRNFTRHRPKPAHSRGDALICIGSLSRPYGAEVLLDIGRELQRRAPYMRLIVTDRFYSASYRAEFMASVQREHLPIDVHPLIPAREVPRLLQCASIGLSVEQDYPGKRLALPTKLFEYMAAGLPVVASDLPNTRQVIEEAACGQVVPPESARAYVEAALGIVTNDARRRELSSNGIEAVESLYSWDAEKRKLIDLFESLVPTSVSIE